MMPDSDGRSHLGAGYTSVYDHNERPVHFQIPTAGAQAVLVKVIHTGLADSSFRCTGCGTTDQCRDGLELLARAGAHASGCGRGTASAALDAEIAGARAEMSRVDPKASGYLQMAGVLLTAGLAVVGAAGAGGHLPPAVMAAGAITAAMVLAAVVLLLLASQPRLTAGHGFVAYADAVDGKDVLARLVGGGDQAAQMSLLTRAGQMGWLSRTVLAKYRNIRLAVWLLLAGYIGAAVTAVLAIRVR